MISSLKQLITPITQRPKLNAMQTNFFIRIEGKIQSIPFDSVIFISSKKNYCEIVTTEQKYLTYGMISSFERQLPKNMFCRVHRSFIISLQKIDWFKHDHVMLVDERKIPINKAGYKAIQERILIVGDCEKGSKIIVTLQDLTSCLK